MKRLVAWLRHEPGLKLVSVLIALSLWAWRESETNPYVERRFSSLTLEPVNLGEGLMVVNDPPLVSAVLSGRRRTLESLALQGEVRAEVDLSAIRQPTWKPLPVRVEVPENVVVRRVEPSEWVAEVDTFETDEKPIRADVGNSSPPQGYVYEPPEVARETAQVKGPRQRLIRVAYLVARIALSGKRANFAGQTPLVPVDSNGQRVDGVTCGPAVVDYRVTITRADQPRSVQVTVPVTGVPRAGVRVQGYRVEPRAVRITGAADGLAQLGGVVSTAPLDVSGSVDSFTRELPLVLPPGVRAEPATVKVRATLVPANRS